MSDDSLSQSQLPGPMQSNYFVCFMYFKAFGLGFIMERTWVQAIHRQMLMLKIKDLVYAKSEKQLVERFDQLLKDSTAVMYPRFIQHVNNYWPRRHKWAICFRQDSLIRGNQTNNYAEAGIKILKEQVANSSGDQLFTGVMKFCERYKKLVKKRFAHNTFCFPQIWLGIWRDGKQASRSIKAWPKDFCTGHCCRTKTKNTLSWKRKSTSRKACQIRKQSYTNKV